MGLHKPLPNRRSNRLRGYDYSLAGAYFMTIVTHNREMLFGMMVGEKMVLNEIGEMVAEEWKRTEILRPNVLLDEFVVMPNHLHGILIIQDVGADRRPPANEGKRAHINAPLRRKGGTMGSIIAGFKSTTTKQINIMRRTPKKPIWHRNYHDRIVRTNEELHYIREYIDSNSLLWFQDDENPNKEITT